MNPYHRLGVRTLINASGTMSYLGGSIMPPDVVAAWVEASKYFVHMDELLAAASREIARLTGAEAGLITAGADAGLSLAAASCIAGTVPDRYHQLPDTTGLKNEVVIPKVCAQIHDRSYAVSGARLIFVGTENGFTADDVERAVGERTAAAVFVYFANTNKGDEALDVMLRTAHRHGLPLILDAAAETPPRENIRKFITMGADVVAFSGGKDIQGPNDTGILYGRKDLIDGATVQMRVLPPFGIGRSMKVGREDVVATVCALDRYMSMDFDAHLAAWERRAQSFIRAFGEHPGVSCTIHRPNAEKHEYTAQCPCRVVITLDERALGVTAETLAQRLYDGEPRIVLGGGGGQISVNPHCLIDGEEEIIARRLREELGGPAHVHPRSAP
ncbi:MAG: aminotransferase class V-fold PLP-dependent enzyme [Candidatus Latescibacteria bacterium]|nr:aminotransferase class V-fold PLP-dependent enzyme [Candidatus Latescibacterota bacterium]